MHGAAWQPWCAHELLVSGRADRAPIDVAPPSQGLMILPAHVTKQQATRCPRRGPARALLVLDRPAIFELVKLMLKHGAFTTRTAATAADGATTLAAWQPHVVILDMDLDGPCSWSRSGQMQPAGRVSRLLP